MDHEITAEENDWAIRQMDPATTRGLDGMAIEDVRRIRKEDLLRVVNGVFQWAPEAIFKGRITPIPKVNNPQQQGDFRPITVLPVVVSLLHRVVVKRLNDIKNVEHQAGFNAGRGTSKNIFLLKNILETVKSRKCSTYVAFLVFRKTFDSVNHNVLLGILEDVGFPPCLLGYLRGLYSKVRLTLGEEWFE